MSKRVFIIRHAKTENALYADKKDFDRVLTARGKSDARLIAERLALKGWKPDFFLSSDAYRAANTTAIIASHLDYNSAAIDWQPSLYLCEPETIDQIISHISTESHNTIFITAHNMGVTEYLNNKVADFIIDNLPTCGVVGFELPIDHWNENQQSLQGSLIYLDFPKHK